LDSLSSDAAQARNFPTTRWTLIFDLQCGVPQVKEKALDSLYQQYWLHIYAFVRRKADTSAEAEDLTQGFFERIITGDLLERAEEARGKLRTFLLTCVENYMRGEWQKMNRQKRGGDVSILTMDSANADQLLANHDSHELSLERAFDQAWAIALIQTIHEQLASEYSARGKAQDFEIMRDFLAN
jgi:RNA polymerase sigma-70 factor (ECF subfamily)